MISTATAKRLIDFGTRLDSPQRAQEQLEGSVALHNILKNEGIAYLADEVGMGKTYVALGALALFRHFDPSFRVLVIAPRETIQRKWMKEFDNFIHHNYQHSDLRVKSLDGRPARPLVACKNLLEFTHESCLDPDRDFFLRLTSFSLPLAGTGQVDEAAAIRLRDELRKQLPWISDEVFSRRNKNKFKDNMARAINLAMPVFDLVIVDEAHNLKHGFSDKSSSRNRVLALALGHSANTPSKKLFPNYGPRAKRVLFLSATPVEDSYSQLYKQLDVFDKTEGFEQLTELSEKDNRGQKIASRFLIRRVTNIKIADDHYTKNLYRREWRGGGVTEHDEPLSGHSTRQRMVVALVQKKVSELLGQERFKRSFQIGMLSSFESFLETARLKGPDDRGNFDDTDQSDDELERQGIDTSDINGLARSYRNKFGMEMPHPKMDALIDALADCWTHGEKHLVFVRRVASVREIKRKLEERYDRWLLNKLEKELAPGALPRFQQVQAQYKQDRMAGLAREEQTSKDEDARQGVDTFFAWFFRGDGPKDVVSGANIQQRFNAASGTYATFFDDNHVAAVLGARPGTVTSSLATALGVEDGELRNQLRERSAKFLSEAKRPARANRFRAAQAAAIEWLAQVKGPHQEHAQIAWEELFEFAVHLKPTSNAPEIGDYLELPTFFTALRIRPELRSALWPEPDTADLRASFRERHLRGQLLASAARLGHPLIDLYVLAVRQLGSIDAGAKESRDDDGNIITEYLAMLESQRAEASDDLQRCSYRELSEIAANYQLILDVNAPDVRRGNLPESTRYVGQLLGEQQPIAGMSGKVNQTVLRQFRMPGYPFVLITTDVLQEGEDLHTFCSSVYHYGISWTPSAIEQRIGRIDRVRSQSDRRLAKLTSKPEGSTKLQVFYPYLSDTVEVLQVRRVLKRVNTFLELMHKGLGKDTDDNKTINVDLDMLLAEEIPEVISTRLVSAFPVDKKHLSGSTKPVAMDGQDVQALVKRFKGLPKAKLGDLDIDWELRADDILFGSVKLARRIQPFRLLLSSFAGVAIVRCISPIGLVVDDDVLSEVIKSAEMTSARIGIIESDDEGTYNLTVEDDVLLGPHEHDGTRIAQLIGRVTSQADWLEKEHLATDEPLSTFRIDLEKEVQGAR